MAHVARRFERLLETHRRPDGRVWGGQDLHEATGGVVTRSYVTNLRKGRIENPGLDKMAAIARAMGFPPAAWFEDALGGMVFEEPDGDARSLAGRVERLFGTVKNPSTGESYTDAEVARMSLGVLAERDVEDIRIGGIPDPTVGQVIALAGAFGVPPSYLLDRGEPPLDEGLIEALQDETVRIITRESAGLPERERRMVLGIVRQFDEARDTDSGR